MVASGAIFASLTSFVGRSKETNALRQLLQTTRLVTLTGAGGVGKTRLALHVAEGLLDTFADGVRVVELASVTDADHLGQAVASQLGISEPPGQPNAEALTDAIRERHMLLVLDNCEHLVEACAVWVDATLRASPALTILATSREALGIQGECIWYLKPLGVPGVQLVASDASPDAALVRHVARSPSVQLFVDRAAAVQPGFALTPENAAAVARICRHLDGLPLAIELAAGRLPVLFPNGIAARLDDPFRLLTGGSRAAMPRQQTLRAALDWSYDLLTPAEQTMFQRASIFAGGWNLAAAEQVCADGLHRDDVLDVLTRLVDKSLVVAEEHHGEGRFRLLAIMRQYAAEKLQAAGEVSQVHTRHLDWCLGLATDFEAEWRGPDQVGWFARLEVEHDNIRAALAWSRAAVPAGNDVGRARVESGLNLAGAVWQFWEVRGHMSEGRSWLTGLLAAAEPVAATAARARALDGAGHLAVLQGDQASAAPLLDESLSLWRALGDKRGAARALHSLGLSAQYAADYSVAIAHHQEALAIGREGGDRVAVYLAIYNLAVVAQEQGDYARSVTLHEESLALKRAQADAWSIAFSLQNLGLLAWRQDQAARAVALLQESLRIRWALQGGVGIAMCLLLLAEIAAGQSQAQRSARLLGAADALLEATGVTLLRGLYSRSPAQGMAKRPPLTSMGITPRLRLDAERAATIARTQIGADAFTRAWGEGQAMRPGAMVEYALEGETGSDHVDPPLSPAVKLFVASVLTRREWDVADLVGRGLTNREIASELVISTWTASTHVRNILAKLGVSRRAQLAAWTVEHRSQYGPRLAGSKVRADRYEQP